MVSTAFALFVALTLARAASAAAPPASAAAIQPFLSDQVVAVVRLDASRVDLKAAETWFAGNLRAGLKEGDKASAGHIEGAVGSMAKGREAAEQFLGAFRKAGGREMVVVLSLDDSFNGPPPVIVPLAQGADADALTKLFGGEAERVGGVLIYGSKEGRDRLRAVHDDKAKRPPHKEMLEALAAPGAADAAVHAAVAPSADARRAIEELSPQLPPQLGGGPITDITSGLRWASVTATAPPKQSLRLLIQSPDAASAETLDKAIDRLIDAAKKGMAAGKAPPPLVDLVSKLGPSREGDRLTLAIEPAQLDEIARAAGIGVIRARSQALKVQSMSNIRQLLLACHMWGGQHKGEWPDDLAAAMKAAQLPAQLAVNPSNPATGYTYIKPPKDAKDAATRIAIYETEATPDGRSAGFVDGHAQFMAEAWFQKELSAQQEADKAAAAKEGAKPQK